MESGEHIHVTNHVWFYWLLLLTLQALKNVVLFVLLAPYDHEQSDLMHRVYEEKKLERIPKYK